MKKKENRLNTIIGMLREQPTLTIRELASVLDVSEMTIRRDLAKLKDSGLLVRALGMNMIGNAQQKGISPAKYDFHNEITRNSEAKRKIAMKAVELINARDVIILDSSTTVSMMVPYIPEDYPLTVIANNYDLISKISKGKAVELVGVGGVYNHDLRMFESDEGLHLIRAHRANKYFFSTSGIHSKLGLTCSYSYEVLSKRASLESSAESILLADSSKFDVVVTSFFAKLQDCNTIITDSGISSEWENLIRNMGIKLYIV